MWQTTLTRKVAPQALKVGESPKAAAILWIAPFSQIRHNYVHSHEHLHTNMALKSHQPLRHNCNYPNGRFKCGFLSKYSLVWLNNSHEPWFFNVESSRPIELFQVFCWFRVRQCQKLFGSSFQCCWLYRNSLDTILYYKFSQRAKWHASRYVGSGTSHFFSASSSLH